MIHEITIPFRFDTGPIEDRLREHGYEEIYRTLANRVEEALLACLNKKLNKYSYYSDTWKSLSDVNWLALVTRCIDHFLEEHTEEIVDEAALLLVTRGSRKKKWREVLAELKDEQAAQ